VRTLPDLPLLFVDRSGNEEAFGASDREVADALNAAPLARHHVVDLDALPQQPFARSVSHTGIPESRSNDWDDLDSDSDIEVPRGPHRRAVSEPAVPIWQQRNFLNALDAVETSLPFAKRRAAPLWRPPSPVVNLALCIVNLLSGCLCPALVDLSKSAIAYGPGGHRRPFMPYSALSVVCAEALFNVALGIVVIAVLKSPTGFAPLLEPKLHSTMLPLTLIYVLGDYAALRAIDSGGGPLYAAIANSKLLVAAAVSHFMLARRQSLRQWFFLAEISSATLVFACLGASNSHGSKHRASNGICWAFAKAILSGCAAVMTESRYKHINLWQANTLLKGQSLVVSLSTMALRSALPREEFPLCGTEAAQHAAWCVDRKGWDTWTWAVLLSEIGTGWLSVAVLTRMSAIAKFICKSATAPSLYLFYCVTGLYGSRFEWPSFLAVSMVAGGIFAYAAEPHMELLRDNMEKLWAGEYLRALRRTD